LRTGGEGLYRAERQSGETHLAPHGVWTGNSDFFRTGERGAAKHERGAPPQILHDDWRAFEARGLALRGAAL